MKKTLLITLIITTSLLSCKDSGRINTSSKLEVGDPIDSFNNVVVYYNGKMGNVKGRTIINGYNIGLRYQCVEFVKRYYYKYYNHRMPNSYGHAKSFYNRNISDGRLNKQRGLTQYSNPSISKPKAGDLIVMSGNSFNKYGHVAIISKVSRGKIEVIQQNVGRNSRRAFNLKKNADGKWKISGGRILGWLRK